MSQPSISPVDAADLVAASSPHAKRRASPRASRPSASCSCTCCCEVRPGHPGAVPRHGPPLPADLAYRDELAARVGAEPGQPAGGGTRVGLWQQSTEACCARHKVEPLFGALEDYDTWFTGLRRDQSPTRANLAAGRAVHAAERQRSCARSARWRAWTTKDVWEYAQGARHPAAAAVRAGLHEHRLRAVHLAAARSVQRALGPLAGTEARMRDPPPGNTDPREAEISRGRYSLRLNRCRTAAARRLAVSLVIHTEHLRLGGIVTACGWLPAVSRTARAPAGGRRWRDSSPPLP